VNIPGSSTGLVHVGEKAIVKFDTFEYSYYGDAEGTVRVVSPSSFYGQDQQTNAAGAVPVSPNDPNAYYRARITIDKLALRGVAADFRPIPGMPVTTDITVGKRTALSYLISRIVQVPQTAMREPQ